MTLDRTSAEQAQILERLENDPHPAWLWPAEGERPAWTNRAAGLFGARMADGEVKRREPAVPVKGQIARILRLGLVGQPTLSRMHFLAGRKPLSATCRCTVMRLDDDAPYLLMVGVDPIAAEIFDAARENEPTVETTESVSVAPAADEDGSGQDAAPTLEGLSALVDKLAQHQTLFEPLEADDDESFPGPVPGRDYAAIAYDAEVEANTSAGQSDWGNDDPLAQEEAAFAADGQQDRGAERAGLWQVTGRGLVLPKTEYQEPLETGGEEPDAASEAVEQTSRYNFEELSRILTDRIGREEPREEAPTPLPRQTSARGALVPLSEEALVLNRLPIGILIFRDQDILFANRALVDLTGYENATTLRGLGLAAVFPTIDAGEPAGPVSHLVRQDGAKVPVNARLNAVTWQGKPSFMLSARASEIEPLREAEVSQFAQLWAKVAGFDFVTADRAGIVTSFVKGTANGLDVSEGAPLTALVARAEQSALRQFLSLPARYAGGVRPAIALKGTRAGQTLTLFAEGRAGIVSGYFGLLGGAAASGAATGKGALPAATLGRITRGLRRPLNTIAGFSELIASESFGPLANPRYLEYARDIRSASAEIGDLADELDDFVRLAEGEMQVWPADVDIATLLAECLVRVRGQASKERVLLRSAISERLPMARVDAGTLKQAVLNMLASAISEAGEGSRVVLSGQVEDDGSISIHVRDGAKAPGALAERFVVFRDGVAADGTQRKPSQSSIGLTLTRSLVAVNACSLRLDPASESGTLMTLTIPASLVVR
ncbi:HAMP domain-containing sensor histidine kinase [Pelagibacterium sp. H642]|uniref:sensor histidine kinase n=1 Tax=Pelagibacterium sp. H642 TaxID=1881069 RepID=UPI002814EA96|nr:HAMP domain-containing sensor histidine kinase [Pelagibacterium sp. H642]WMT91445.1 HAMP domain-containing histidine kinase [Pelagibacterium sp. H642]